jgi:hypothetical protein
VWSSVFQTLDAKLSYYIFLNDGHAAITAPQFRELRNYSYYNGYFVAVDRNTCEVYMCIRISFKTQCWFNQKTISHFFFICGPFYVLFGGHLNQLNYIHYYILFYLKVGWIGPNTKYIVQAKVDIFLWIYKVFVISFLCEQCFEFFV